MNKVVTILDEYNVCLQHEITDRVYYIYGVNCRNTSRAIEHLLSKSVIQREEKSSPYNIPFHFYFLTGTSADRVNNIINYKLDLLWNHSKLRDDIGRFCEELVARILENNGYTEVEIRKEKHGDIGFGRREMDVFAKHVFEYYQHIEVKNRRQPVNSIDIRNLEIKTRIADRLWNLPIESALVCTYIYKKALREAKSRNIPVVITNKIYIPEKYAGFYKEYSTALGSYYFKVINSEKPPKHLTRKIIGFIRGHDYKK
jgi:Holliday junction resolvase-like predicted endonuclease